MQYLALRIVIVLSISSSTIQLHSQDICGNLVDDDGDCNIDCDDRSCGVFTDELLSSTLANFVVGQQDFTSAISGASTSLLGDPYDIAHDPTSDKVFVTDQDNNRVLRYASVDQFLFNGIAEAVIGQPNFTSSGSGLSSTRFSQPTGIFVDAAGILWVTDWGNSRVLRFNNAANLGNGPTADGVLGQSNFSSGGSALSQTRMNTPVDVFVEDDGTLWVADQNNGRVLRFDNASAKANGAAADAVLGQANYTSSGSTASQSVLGSASGVVVICSALYVSDQNSSRVVKWNDPQLKVNGASADGVLGQANFSNTSSGLGQGEFDTPRILTSDKHGHLYVADASNHRVLVFHEVGSKLNNANADVVLAQPNFTTGSSGLSQMNINGPRGIAILENTDRTFLAVADRYNNRILVWGGVGYSTNEVTALNGTLQGTSPSGGALTFSVAQQPTLGSVTISDPSTGAFVYTPAGVCPTDQDSLVSFLYSVSNTAGCSASGEVTIEVLNIATCVDVDMDGVDALGDLDDDNDGIPDEEEGGSDQDISGTIGIGNNLVSASSFALNGTSVTYTSGFPAGECYAYDAGLQGHALYLTNNDPSFKTLRIDFGTDVENLSFKVTDIDFDEEYDLWVYDENSLAYDLLITGVNSLGAQVVQSPTGTRFSADGTASNLNGNDPANDGLSSVIYHFPNKVSALLFSIKLDNNTSLRITELDFNVLDSDNDGLFDHVDLDSDNDGIYDLIEAGHSAPDIDNNGIVDGPVLAFGSNGLLDALETSGGSGVLNYMVRDSDVDGAIDARELDADNDGCYDVIEAGYSDGDNDGRLGTKPLIVDLLTGLVISGGP